MENLALEPKNELKRILTNPQTETITKRATIPNHIKSLPAARFYSLSPALTYPTTPTKKIIIPSPKRNGTTDPERTHRP